MVVGSLILSSAATAGPGIALFGALVLGLGLLGASLSLLRRGRGRGSTAEVVRPEGRDAPAVRVTGTRGPVVAQALTLAWVALVCFAGAAVAASSGRAAVTVVLVVVGLLGAATLVVPVLRGLAPDQVDLDPRGIVAWHHGGRVETSWDEIEGCVPPQGPEQPLALVLRTGTEPRVLSRTWPLWKGPGSAPVGVQAVFVRDLGVDPVLLARVVALCADDPSLRARLGTAESADWRRFPPVAT